MRKIRADYPYNKIHTPQTFTAIMKHLAAANEARDLRKANIVSGFQMEPIHVPRGSYIPSSTWNVTHHTSVREQKQ